MCDHVWIIEGPDFGTRTCCRDECGIVESWDIVEGEWKPSNPGLEPKRATRGCYAHSTVLRPARLSPTLGRIMGGSDERMRMAG